jgi:ferredoxin-NADP reductase
VILAIEPQTPRIQSFFLAPEQPFSFVAGQHLKVRVATRSGYEERSYSIASAPEDGAIIELAIEALPGGEVSGHFHRIAEVGDKLEIRGPLGKFVWSVADGPALLIGGGSGLVPLMSMIRHRTARRSQVKLGLIFSAMTWDDVLYRDELIALAETQDGFELMLTLTRESTPREGHGSRRIDVAMVQTMLDGLGAAVSGVFVCGSDPFVEAAVGAVKAAGVTAPISTEEYGE